MAYMVALAVACAVAGVALTACSVRMVAWLRARRAYQHTQLRYRVASMRVRMANLQWLLARIPGTCPLHGTGLPCTPCAQATGRWVPTSTGAATRPLRMARA